MSDDGDIWGLLGSAVFAMASTYGLLLLVLTEEWSPLRYGLVSTAVVVGYVVSFFTFANWVMPRLIWWYDSIRNVATRTENVRLMEEAARMSDAQIEAVRGKIPTIHWVGGEHGPIEYLSLGAGRDDIPMWFVRRFFELSSAAYCVAVRTFSEGTHERVWCSELTLYLVEQNLAEPAAGNLAAQWVDGLRGKNAAAVWCGVIPPPEEG